MPAKASDGKDYLIEHNGDQCTFMTKLSKFHCTRKKRDRNSKDELSVVYLAGDSLWLVCWSSLSVVVRTARLSTRLV
jgi:hypothetical protein